MGDQTKSISLILVVIDEETGKPEVPTAIREKKDSWPGALQPGPHGKVPSNTPGDYSSLVTYAIEIAKREYGESLASVIAKTGVSYLPVPPELSKEATVHLMTVIPKEALKKLQLHNEAAGYMLLGRGELAKVRELTKADRHGWIHQGELGRMFADDLWAARRALDLANERKM